ncbi:Uncharacterized protein Rs2_21410 [Raphanus sativus]|nr:Uncharacterized protein Rs2_21410 [Raphanus sativus]
MELEVIKSSSQLNHMQNGGNHHCLSCIFRGNCRSGFIAQSRVNRYECGSIYTLTNFFASSSKLQVKQHLTYILVDPCSTCRISSKLNVLNPTELLGRPLRQIFKCLATMPIDLECYICHGIQF